jgi:hypothetical protein
MESIENLVERLRQPWPPSNSEDPLMVEAAELIEKLAAALIPFAECARVFDPDMIGGTMPKTGEWQSWPRMVDGKIHTYTLTVEHLREARAVLGELGDD